MPDVVISLRLDPRNLEALEAGVRGRVNFVRLAVGVDGVHELELKGTGENPLPHPHAEPDVPLLDP